MICVPYCTSKYGGPNPDVIIPTPKGSTSEWTEIGSRLDSFNDGTLEVTAAPLKPPPHTTVTGKSRAASRASSPQAAPPPPPPPFTPQFTVEFGVKQKGGSVESIASFKNTPTALSIQVAFDANTIATKRVRVVDAALNEALAEAKSGTVPPGSKGAVSKFPVCACHSVALHSQCVWTDMKRAHPVYLLSGFWIHILHRCFYPSD